MTVPLQNNLEECDNETTAFCQYMIADQPKYCNLRNIRRSSVPACDDSVVVDTKALPEGFGLVGHHTTVGAKRPATTRDCKFSGHNVIGVIKPCVECNNKKRPES